VSGTFKNIARPAAPQTEEMRQRMHRTRIDIAAVMLTNTLRAAVDAGCASPNDLQLLAALDRWAAGELV